MNERIEQIQNNLALINSKIEAAAKRSGRKKEDVSLVVVTKLRPVEIIRETLAAGAKILGENYADEAKEKIDNLRTSSYSFEWHMIGHVQSRKAKIIAEDFDMLHSLDSIKLAEKLESYLSLTGKVLPVLLELNVSGEESKCGWPAWDHEKVEMLLPVIDRLKMLPHLKISGLMTMPPLFESPESTRPYFKKLRTVQEYFCSQVSDIDWNVLSMGTSADFEIAIEEGATFVRVGQAILGPRPPKE